MVPVTETVGYGYNNHNTLASISFSGSGSTIGDMSYSWDANKNKTAESISGTMSNYGFSIPSGGYDAEDRLVEYNRTSGLNQSWSLTAVGNWSSLTTNSVTENRTHGPTHELLTVASETVTHDVKGNITLIPEAARATPLELAMTWDFDNRMVTADRGNSGSVVINFTYDALGRRVSRGSNVHVHCGQQTIADYTAGAAPGSATYHYAYGSYIDEPVMRFRLANSNRLYYHRNQQYSIVALTNSSGNVSERYAYTTYGLPTITLANGTPYPLSPAGNRYLYTGREWESLTELYYYYRARMYDPQLGRFLGRDPIKYRSGHFLYAYVGSSPLYWLDPSGMKEICISIPFPNDPKTECASWWNWMFTDKTFEIDPDNPDWSELNDFLDGLGPDDCIGDVIFSGHGSPGTAGPINSPAVTDPNSEIHQILAKLGSKMCSNGMVDLRHCLCAKGEKGQKFLTDLAITIGRPVKGIDDWYAVVPHGDEYIADPSGDIRKTCSRLPYKDSWFCAWQQKEKKGNKPDKSKPKVDNPVKDKPDIQKCTGYWK